MILVFSDVYIYPIIPNKVEDFKVITNAACLQIYIYILYIYTWHTSIIEDIQAPFPNPRLLLVWFSESRCRKNHPPCRDAGDRWKHIPSWNTCTSNAKVAADVCPTTSRPRRSVFSGGKSRLGNGEFPIISPFLYGEIMLDIYRYGGCCMEDS